MGEETQVIPFIRHSPAAGWYVSEWQRGKRATEDGGVVRMAESYTEYDQAQFNRVMMDALNRRINLRGGLTAAGTAHAGRRTQPEYQAAMRREAYEIQYHRQRRHRCWGLNGQRWQTDVFHKRLAHLIVRDDD